MITNNSSENPKSVKGSKNASSSGSGGGEGEEEKKEKQFKTSREFVREHRRSNYYGYCPAGRGRGKGRGRRDDFAGSRGGGRFFEDRRGGFRGGRSSRRGRDDDSSYNSRTRFQEPLNKNKSDLVVSSSSSKFYSGEYRSSKPGIPEDSKISSILRRMAREDDIATYNILCKFLQDSMTLADNEAYIRRSMEIISDSLIELIKYGQGDSFKLGAAICLGHLGHNLGKDAKRFLDLMFRKYANESNVNTMNYFLKALIKLAKLDLKNPKLGENSKPLMRELQQILEATDAPDVYVSSAEAILILTQRYPDHFTEFFHDAIDIIVGWHIDSTVNGTVADFSSDCLRSLSSYWIQDVCFTVSLLGQILEDATSYSEEPLDTSDTKPFAKATAFIGVFSAVFEGAKEAMDPTKCKQITWTFHSDTITQICNTVLKMTETLVFCPLIKAGNNCARIIMAYMRYKTEQVQKTLFNYISKQFDLGSQLETETVTSLIALISKVVCDSAIELPEDLVNRMFCPDSFLLTLRFDSMQENLYDIYAGLMKRRDIKLIKLTYKWILFDLESAIKTLLPDLELLPQPSRDPSMVVKNYSNKKAVKVILFYLNVLKKMSYRGGYLVWISVLKPNLFQLLAEKILPALSPIEHSSIYHLVISVFRLHCYQYGEFISTSCLISSSDKEIANEKSDGAEVNSSLPTGNHLTTILNFMGKTLKMVMSEDTKLEIIKWAGCTMDRCGDSLNSLKDSEVFWLVVAGLCRVAVDRSVKIAIASASAIRMLAVHYNAPWKKEYLDKVIRLCSFFVNSPSRTLQKKYLSIIPRLPSLHVLVGIEQFCKDLKGYNRNLEMCLYSAMNRGETGEIQDLHFREVMIYILHGLPKSSSKTWLLDMVYRCWAVCEFDLGQRVVASERALESWILGHCSYLVASSKLKTPLGKPAQTLVAIESAFRELSKEIMNQKVSKYWRNPMTGNRVRLLVDFVEHLEKEIYNNIEGTASAMPSRHQSIKSFFITNKGSCSEWLSRIRLIVMFVCIHIGLSSYAVRHGFSYLQHLVENKNTQGLEFEMALLYTGWALCNMKEPEALMGLYSWAKDSHSTKMPLLKPLSDKANSRLEDAAIGFQNLINSSSANDLNEPNEPEQELPSNSLKTFIADQLTETLISVKAWDDLLKWKSNQEKVYLSQENGNSYQLYKYIDADYVEALRDMDCGKYERCSKELSDWKSLKVPAALEKSGPKWNYYDVMNYAEHTLAKIALNSVNNTSWKMSKRMLEKLDCCRELVDDVIKESVKDPPSPLLEPALILKYAAESLTSDENCLDNQILDYDKVKKKLKSPEMCRIVFWLNVLNSMPKRVKNSNLSENFILQVCKIARKEGNMKLAKVCLLNRLDASLDEDLIEVSSKIIATSDNKKCLTSGLTELSKQLFKSGEVNLACGISLISIETSKAEGNMESASKNLARLARWIESKPDIFPILKHHPRLTNALSLPSSNDAVSFLCEESEGIVNLNAHLSEPSSDQDRADFMVARLLTSSIMLWPSLGKAWATLAGSALLWAGEMTCAPPDLSNLNISLPPSIEADKVSAFISETPPKMHLDNIDTMEGADGLKMFLVKIGEFGQLSPEETDTLTAIWRKSHKKVFDYFSLGAYAYFKFLQNQSNQSCVVLATLRLVRLLCHHPVEMEPLYQVMMPLTPTEPWVWVAPQLFSRLSHPHAYPRKKTAELLVRIGTDFPHLIVFQAIVGSNTESSTIKDMPSTNLFSTNQKSDAGEIKDEDIEDELKFLYEEEDNETYDDEDAPNKDEESSVLENSYKTIVDSLSKQCGNEMLSEVTKFVSELRRITVLWDELWLGTIKQRMGDIVRMFNRLSTEVELTSSNQNLEKDTKDSLILEKHKLILKPLLFVLEQLHRITSVPAETPHETQFQEKFGKIIEETLSELKDPIDPKNPDGTFSAMKRLEKALTQAADTGGKPLVYNMSDVSPILANMKDTMISMPGLAKSKVTIAGVANSVPVLATMTKPKKLVLIGSDGKEYTYLFKGLEDLHLDERVMQFLSTVNRMLPNPLRAIHYSVVPLGPRSGLISWVENVTPIFSIYKRWQHNQAKAAAANNANTSTPAVLPPTRPLDLYYSVLTPLLQDVGMKADPQYRASWPLYILKKTLTTLTSQTPAHLLSKEMWCMSACAGSWWEGTKLYSTSLAVMSMIGYIIGLGDRHLDNVMVNLRTGQVVHIDYNVCFEKGKTLRVPEKVPFRLTPNLVNALGVTGIEGLFRLTCEKVLDVLQTEKETLLTLLEAFVYDPLIDWTPLNETGYTGAVYGGGRGVGQEMKQSRRQLEREVTLAMFSVRLVEISHEWNGNKLKVESELREFIKLIEEWFETNRKLSSVMTGLQERHSHMAYLKEAEGQPNHLLFSLGSRFEKYQSTYNAKMQLRTSLEETVKESEFLLSHYQRLVDLLRIGEVAKWRSQVAARPKQDICTVFDLIKEFLQNAGQTQTVIQCADSELAVSQICAQQNELIVHLTDLLLHYWDIAKNYPVSFSANHRSQLYKKWALMLLEDMSCFNTVGFEMSAKLTVSEDEMLLRSRYYSDLVLLGTSTATLISSNASQSQKSESFDTSEPAAELVALSPPLPILSAAVASCLLGLNSNLLRLESVAIGNTRSGDLLASLMSSQEGDWFLEDILLTSSLIQEVTALFPSPAQDTLLHSSLKIISTVHNRYLALQAFDMNVRTIIVNEAIQLMRCEEPSVLTVCHLIDSIVSSAEMPLSDIVQQLHMQLSVIANNSDCDSNIASSNSAITAAKKIVNDLSSLLVTLERKGHLTPGEMLLLGFMGLFDQLATKFDALPSLLANFTIPTNWSCLGQVIDSKTYAVRVNGNEGASKILSLLFAVKRLSTISETLTLCRVEGDGWSTARSPPTDPNLLAHPARLFVADYVRLRLLGLIPYCLAVASASLLNIANPELDLTAEGEKRGNPKRIPLEDICADIISNGSIDEVYSGEESKWIKSRDTISRYCKAWESRLIRERKDREETALRNCQARIALITTTYHWLYDQYLLASPAPPFNRVQWIADISKAVGSFYSLQNRMKESLEQQTSLIANAEQRLRWASGANPALIEVLSAFEESVTKFRERLASEKAIAIEIISLANCVMQYEALRVQSQDTHAVDTAFALLIEESNRVYLLKQISPVKLSPVEEGLATLCHPPEQVSSEWISDAEKKLSDSIHALQRVTDPLQKELFALEDCIKNKSMALRYEMGKHNRIISDVRELFKVMVKFEDSAEMGLEGYLSRYKEYTDRMSKMTKRFTLPEAFSEKRLTEVLIDAQYLAQATNDIYDNLLAFSFTNNNEEGHTDSDLNKKKVKKYIQTKSVQEKNSFAVSVWRRIKMKLEGRDPDPGVRSAVHQQVKWTINEATSPDNLATLYEGWTPWV